jgi:hypothetical protein
MDPRVVSFKSYFYTHFRERNKMEYQKLYKVLQKRDWERVIELSKKYSYKFEKINVSELSAETARYIEFLFDKKFSEEQTSKFIWEADLESFKEFLPRIIDKQKLLDNTIEAIISDETTEYLLEQCPELVPSNDEDFSNYISTLINDAADLDSLEIDPFIERLIKIANKNVLNGVLEYISDNPKNNKYVELIK